MVLNPDRKEKVIQILFEAVKEFNKTMPAERRLEPALGTELLGDSSPLDSVDLIKFGMELDKRIRKEFKRPLNLFKLDLQPSANPFRTVGTLADYVTGLLDGEKNG